MPSPRTPMPDLDPVRACKVCGCSGHKCAVFRYSRIDKCVFCGVRPHECVPRATKLERADG